MIRAVFFYAWFANIGTTAEVGADSLHFQNRTANRAVLIHGFVPTGHSALARELCLAAHGKSHSAPRRRFRLPAASAKPDPIHGLLAKQFPSPTPQTSLSPNVSQDCIHQHGPGRRNVRAAAGTIQRSMDCRSNYFWHRPIRLRIFRRASRR